MLSFNSPKSIRGLDALSASRAQYHIGGSERPSSIVMGNHDEREDDHEEIATNYVESGESFNRKTTVVDINFT